jgi:non-homologous end joining protein Ku
VKPEEAGRKPYALLYEAMREAEFAAVAQFAMHRCDRVAILRPGPVGAIGSFHVFRLGGQIR